MRSFKHILLFSHFALGLILLLVVGNTPSPALAAPMPFLSMRSSGFVRGIEARIDAGEFAMTESGVTNSIVPTIGGNSLRRDLNIGDLNILNTYFNEMHRHADGFRTLARQPASERDADFQEQCADELQGFHTNLLGFQQTLAELGANKGLANYDRDNDLETLLKDLVNAVKYLLKDINALVYSIPGLGPVLGPIVYEIKCILDNVLNAVENLTDAIINALEPLLRGVITQASKTACHSGIQIAGFCVML